MKGKVRIILKGCLDKQWKDHFEGMELSHEAGNTVLTGTLKDEAHLHGILELIRDLNLILVSVNPEDHTNGQN
ncbi:MAG: hypothetical protein U0X39_05895 [Bacteroidales bacterium]